MIRKIQKTQLNDGLSYFEDSKDYDNGLEAIARLMTKLFQLIPIPHHTSYTDQMWMTDVLDGCESINQDLFE